MKTELNHLLYMVTITSKSPEETFALGKRWAGEVKTGWVIGLDGNLGSGKTQLVKGIAKGLSIAETITSPTFTLAAEYEGVHKLDHLVINTNDADGFIKIYKEIYGIRFKARRILMT